MAHIDLTSRRLELQIVLWGPPGSGTSTALRSLHGAAPAHTRGDLASLEHTDGRRVVCDYAPLDLPRWGAQAVRAHVYTMSAGQGLRGAQWRILAGADAVLFLADARPAALAADQAAWAELVGALVQLGERGPRLPVWVASTFADAPETLEAGALTEALQATARHARVVGSSPTVPPTGAGLAACFAALAAAAAADAQPGSEGSPEAAGFVAALREALESAPGRPAAPTPAGEARRVRLPSAHGSSDGTGAHMALDVSRWLALRELDVRRLQRERALGGLLLEVGQTCLGAADTEGLARRVLGTLTMNLEAVSGWLGLPDGAHAMRVFDPMGASTDGAAFVETAEALALGVRDGGVAPVGAETGALLPGGAVGGRGLFAPFPVGDGRRGWLLLVGPPDRGLPEDAEPVLASAGAFVGLSVARLRALQRLRETNGVLEQRVEERTQDLLREKHSLEERVRERTAELEQAKQASLEAERRLLDRERHEGLHRLAAGLAHELNNPIGAALADLDYLLEGLERLAASVTGLAASELGDLLSSGQDARRELRRLASSVTALVGQAASSRREAVRASLVQTVREAVQTFASTTPGARLPRLQALESVACGLPPVEGARWLFRLLSGLSGCGSPAAQIEVGRSPEGPRLLLRLDREGPSTASVVRTLAADVERSGAHVTLTSSAPGATVEVILPPALGESCIHARPAAEPVR